MQMVFFDPPVENGFGEFASASKHESQVVEIRTLAASGYSNRQLSAKFGFGVGMIQAIVSRRTWRHI